MGEGRAAVSEAPLFSAFIPGEPVPFSWRANGHRRYVPARQRQWMNTIADAAQAIMSGHPPHDGPLRVEAVFYMPRPKAGKYDEPIGRPDLSNLWKLAEDAITEAGVWADDARITRVEAAKLYASQLQPAGFRVRVYAA